MTAMKTGGEPEIRVACLGGSDVVAALISKSDGGSHRDSAFREAVTNEFGDGFSVSFSGSPVESSRALLEMIRADHAVFDPAPDIVVLSVVPDVDKDIDPSEFRSNLAEAIGTIKSRYDARIIAFNASTFDPADETTTFANVQRPYPLRIHQLDLELMRLAVSEGISLIDVDRLMAELGAGKHVPAVLEHSPKALEAIGDEFMRVVKEYGFFEKRPLLAQVGKKGA